MNISRKPDGKVVAVALISVALIIIFLAVGISSCTKRLNFSARYFFVYYKLQDDAHSASSISSTVQNLGGAGYVLEHDGRYYITVSCYYTQSDAEEVCAGLKRRGAECAVLEKSVDGFTLRGNAERNSEKYLGNLNTLASLSRICYDTANAMDKGEYDRTAVKNALAGVETGLKALRRENFSNCFSEGLSYLLTECADVGGDYIYSRDMRRLQIAIADCILNADLY